MGDPKLTNILIGVLVISLTVTGFTMFLGKGAVDYNVISYNNTTLSVFQDAAEDINNVTLSTKSTLDAVGSGTDSAFDIFGSFFSSAWSALRTTGQSINVLTKIGKEGVGLLPFSGGFFTQASNIVITSIIIIITIGIFFHFIRQSNRL